MKRKFPRRLIQLALAFVLLAAPTIWVGRQLHQQTLNRALIAAIKRSDSSAVDSLLAAGADPNTRDTPPRHESFVTSIIHIFHPTPELSALALTLAIEQRFAENSAPVTEKRILTALLAKGANPNGRDGSGVTPMSELIVNCRVRSEPEDAADAIEEEALIVLLLNAGANIEAPGQFGETPLMDACSNYVPTRPEVVRLLVSSGANINAKPVPQYQSPLSEAIECGDADIITLLKAYGAKE